MVFDFDGVLVDTNEVKQRAYFDVLRPMGVGPSTIEDALRSRAGADRHDVIAEAVRRAGIDADVPMLVRRYGDICDEFAVQGPEIPGAATLLALLAPRFPLYLNSATPERALRIIVERRGWRGYFRDVLGRPGTKTVNLRTILARERIRPPALVFVGDGPLDAAAAIECGCRFVAFRGGGGDVDGPESIRTLDELIPLLGS